MLHIVSTMMFLGAGMFAIATIVAMLVDNASVVAHVLGLHAAPVPLPARTGRVRVVRSPRFMPMSPVRSRAAA